MCCGFGGLFCVKYPDISNRMAQKKIADIVTTAQPVKALVSIDLGCLLHLAGKLHRDGVDLQALHIAELLDGLADNADGAAGP
jgi:L-lactate dehydrogenase complex protein LldE